MSQGSLDPKIRFICQNVCSVARVHTVTQTHRQTDTKVNTEDTLSGFQDFFSFKLSVQYISSSVAMLCLSIRVRTGLLKLPIRHCLEVWLPHDSWSGRDTRPSGKQITGKDCSCWNNGASSLWHHVAAQVGWSAIDKAVLGTFVRVDVWSNTNHQMAWYE